MKLRLPIVAVALLLASPLHASEECPGCDPVDAWFAENGDACWYHENRIPSVCNYDPECLEWNRRCGEKREETRACIARCMAGDHTVQGEELTGGTELDEFERDMAAMEREGFDPFADQQSAEWCEARRRNLAERARSEDRARSNRDWRQAQFEKGIIGFVIAQTGQSHVYRCGGVIEGMSNGTPIRIGDCIQTSSNGRLRIQMMDRDDGRNSGPTVINLGRNSRMCANEFYFGLPDDGIRRDLVDLATGAIKVLFSGWGNKSNFNVRAGVAVCGIRGSEVIVGIDKNGGVQAAVIEGQAWLGNLDSREIRQLIAGQWAQDPRNGPMSQVKPLSQELWDKVMAQQGLDLEGSADALNATGCTAAAGDWRWSEGFVYTLAPDGQWWAPNNKGSGSWSCAINSYGDAEVVITPDPERGNWWIRAVVAPDGLSLSGQRENGTDVDATREHN